MKLWFKGTISLVAAITAGYLFFSKGAIFIPTGTLAGLSYSFVSLQNFLVFNFIHIGPTHLIVNLVSLAGFGLIAEKHLKSRDVFGIFFLSSIIAGTIFVAVNQNIGLIGASAGVSGLTGTAIMLKPKQGIIAIIVVSLIGSAIVFAAEDSIATTVQSKEKEIVQAKQDIKAAEQKQETQKAEQLKKELEKKQIETQQIKQGIEIQAAAPTDALVHSLGALTGIGYLMVFRKKEFEKGIKEFMPIFRILGVQK